MNSLFLRLFFGFWLVMLTTIVASNLLLSSLRSDQRPPRNTFEQRIDDAHQMLRRSQALLWRHGEGRWLDALYAAPGQTDWTIVYTDGRAISRDGELDEALVELAAEVPEGRRPFRRQFNNQLVLARKMRTSDRQPYAVVLITLPQPHPLALELLYSHLWLRLLIAFTGTGLLCYWMARRYAQPIEALRGATRAIAGGDLQSRVRLSGGSDEIAELGNDFNQMAQSLHDAREQQQHLLHAVSHELRSPLARMQAALGLAQQRGGDDAELSRIEREIETLNHLIDQLLRSGRSNTPQDVVDLVSLLELLVANNQIEADTRQQLLSLSCDEPALLILADAVELPAAIENVIRNALHYGPPDSTIAVTLASKAPSQVISISVDDAGDGVPTAQLETIFESFTRADTARGHASGYGLGLAIARRTAVNHGGRIFAGNTETGFRVTLELPRTLLVTG